MNKALFLDRDGVINERIVGGYVQRPDEFHLIDAILPVLQAARAAGYKLVLITNQQGVGKGLMSREDLDALHRLVWMPCTTVRHWHPRGIHAVNRNPVCCSMPSPIWIWTRRSAGSWGTHVPMPKRGDVPVCEPSCSASIRPPLPTWWCRA